MDWSKIAKNIVYTIPAAMTKSVGRVIAEFLDRLVELEVIHPSDIHLIGHSLGAHVVGSCGRHLKSGKIGRITGEQIIRKKKKNPNTFVRKIVVFHRSRSSRPRIRDTSRHSGKIERIKCRVCRRDSHSSRDPGLLRKFRTRGLLSQRWNSTATRMRRVANR